MKNAIQQAVVDMRRQLGLTQQGLAVAMGRAVITVSRWETDRTPSGQSLVDLSNFARGKGVIDSEEVFAAALRDSSTRRRIVLMNEIPTIVCLCGSTRFWRQFQEANARETLAGKIVLSVGFFVHYFHSGHMDDPPQIAGLHDPVTDEQKTALDALHLKKIEMADEVLFLNVGGYMGESTRAELAYAKALGKQIRFLEPRSETE